MPVLILTPVNSTKVQLHVLAVVAAGVAVQRMYCVPLCYRKGSLSSTSLDFSKAQTIFSTAWVAVRSWVFIVRSGLNDLVVRPSKHSCLAWLWITMSRIEI